MNSSNSAGMMLTFARLRPLDQGADERRRLSFEVHRADDYAEADEETLQLFVPEEYRNAIGNKELARYKFTGVLEDDISQEDAFQAAARDTVSGCLRGISGAIFAYGQTNSGKTWTVTGGHEFSDRGLAPRAIGQVFREIRDAETREVSISYKVRASYLEVYEERVYDLLDVSNRDKPMEEWSTVSLMADGEGNRVLKGGTIFDVDNEEDTLNLLFMGNSHRIMGETPANRASSRSHAVFTLAISSKREEIGGAGAGGDGDGSTSRTIVSRAELSLVDLAGCERMYKNDRHGYSAGLDDNAAVELAAGYSDASSVVSAQGVRKSAREREGKSINLSLHKLEKVMLALKNPGTHVPFRDSSLTSILRRSLGGKCQTVFVVTLSLDVEDLPETAASCRFAQSCRKVFCRPVADEHLEPAQELRLLRREAADMRASIMAKDDLLRVVADEVQDKEDDLEAITRRLETIEAARAFHTARVPTEEDREACAVLAQALADGSEEAEEALEGLDRVSAVQCCRELQEILLRPPPPPPPPKIFVEAGVCVTGNEEEFKDEAEEMKREEEKKRISREKEESEQIKQLLAVTLSENAELLVELRHQRDQLQALKSLESEKLARQEPRAPTVETSQAHETNNFTAVESTIGPASTTSADASFSYPPSSAARGYLCTEGGALGVSECSSRVQPDNCTRETGPADGRSGHGRYCDPPSNHLDGIHTGADFCGVPASVTTNKNTALALLPHCSSSEPSHSQPSGEVSRRTCRDSGRIDDALDATASAAAHGDSNARDSAVATVNRYDSDGVTAKAATGSNAGDRVEHCCDESLPKGSGGSSGGSSSGKRTGRVALPFAKGDQDSCDASDSPGNCEPVASSGEHAGDVRLEWKRGREEQWHRKGQRHQEQDVGERRGEGQDYAGRGVREQSWVRQGEPDFDEEEEQDEEKEGEGDEKGDEGFRDDEEGPQDTEELARHELMMGPMATSLVSSADPDDVTPLFGQENVESGNGHGPLESHRAQDSTDFDTAILLSSTGLAQAGGGPTMPGHNCGHAGSSHSSEEGGSDGVLHRTPDSSSPNVSSHSSQERVRPHLEHESSVSEAIVTDGTSSDIHTVTAPCTALSVDRPAFYSNGPSYASAFDPLSGDECSSDSDEDKHEEAAHDGRWERRGETKVTVDWGTMTASSLSAIVDKAAIGLKPRPVVARNLGTRNIGEISGDDGGDGRPPPLIQLALDDDSTVADPDISPLVDRKRRYVHYPSPCENHTGDGQAMADGEGDVNVVGARTEWQRALLMRGGFFIVHSRFGKSHMRFVWMSRDLGTIFWRCWGQTGVKGSVKTISFDSVHLGSTGSNHEAHSGGFTTTVTRAATLPLALLSQAGSTGNSLKQIVLTGARGRNRLVLELDAGKMEPEAELEERDSWLEAFKYAVNVANVEVITRMLGSSKRSTMQPSTSKLVATTVPRRSSLSRSSATARRVSLNRTAPASLTAVVTGSGQTGNPSSARITTQPPTSGDVDLRSSESRSRETDASPMRSLPAAPRSLQTENEGRRRSTNAGGGGSRLGGKGIAAPEARNYTFVRPPAIDTSNLVGAMGPSSPPPRGKPAALSISDAVEFISATTATDGCEDEQQKSKRVAKVLATEAATVVSMQTLTPTGILISPSSRGEVTARSPPNTGGGGGDSRRGIMLPLRPPAAVATHLVGDTAKSPPLSSPRARVGSIRRGSESSTNSVGFSGDVHVNGDDLTDTSAMRWARGKTFGAGRNRRGTDDTVKEGSRIRWGNERILFGDRNRRSSSGRDPERGADAVVGAGDSELAGGKLPSNSRSYGRFSFPAERRTSAHVLEDKSIACKEEQLSPPPRGTSAESAGDQCADSKTSSLFVQERATSVATRAASMSLERKSELYSSLPARGLTRGVARRLSAIGTRALASIGGGGNVHGDGGVGGGGGDSPRGSPGAKGDGPPPPPSHEQRRRMSAAPLTEQLMVALNESPPASSLPPPRPTQPSVSGARRKSVQQLGTWMASGVVGVRERASSAIVPSSPRARDVGSNTAAGASLSPILASATPPTTCYKPGYPPALVIGSPRARGGVTMV